MNILITGANGFIGSHLVNNLAAAGNNILAVTRKPILYSSALVRGVVADLSEKNYTHQFNFTADAVILLAQSRKFREANGEEDVMNINSYSVQHLLDWAKQSGVKKIILASTGSVYKQKGKALREEDAVVESGTYPLSKLMAEQIARAYSNFFDVNILRLFTPYGPGQTGMLISKIIENVSRGEVIQLAEGKGIILSPVYIEDCCEIIKLVLTKKLSSDLYNLGGSEILSLGEIIHVIETELNIKANLVTTEEKSPYIATDSSKLMSEINYVQRIKIKEGIHRTIHSR